MTDSERLRAIAALASEPPLYGGGPGEAAALHSAGINLDDGTPYAPKELRIEVDPLDRRVAALEETFWKLDEAQKRIAALEEQIAEIERRLTGRPWIDGAALQRTLDDSERREKALARRLGILENSRS